MVDTTLRLGSRAGWNVLGGVAGTVEAFSGALEEDAQKQGKRGIVGGPIREAGRFVGQQADIQAREATAYLDPARKALIDADFTESPGVLLDPEWWAGRVGDAAGSIMPFVALGVAAGAPVGGFFARTSWLRPD